MYSVRTLYIRNVPDDVARRLEAMAADEGVSLNALAVRELSDVSRRPLKAELLADLVPLDIDIDEVIEDIRAGRDERDRR